MRQNLYTIAPVLWCAAFPAGQCLMEVVVASPDGTLPQAVATVVTMLGLAIAAVLLDPNKNQRSAYPPRL